MTVIAALDDPASVLGATGNDADVPAAPAPWPYDDNPDRRAFGRRAVMHTPARSIAGPIGDAEPLAHLPSTPRARPRVAFDMPSRRIRTCRMAACALDGAGAYLVPRVCHRAMAGRR